MGKTVYLTKEQYETLKKIFQFCDKVNNEKPEGQE